jgi:hypothetical protein
MNYPITPALLLATLILFFSCKKSNEGHIQFLDNFKDNIIENNLGEALDDKGIVIVEASPRNVNINNAEIFNSMGYGVLVKAGASDFGINDPAANNTLEGDLGGSYM